MNTLSLTSPAPSYFMRTPEGRKKIDLPKDIQTDDDKAAHLVMIVEEEADSTGWAILDEVNTSPRLHVMKSMEKAAEVQAARQKPAKKARRVKA